MKASTAMSTMVRRTCTFIRITTRQLGRIHEYKPKETKQEVLRFEVGKVKQKYQDPYRQAQYAYTQIREVQDEG